MYEYDDLARIVANLSKKMCFNFESLKHGFSCSRRVGRPAVAAGGGASTDYLLYSNCLLRIAAMSATLRRHCTALSPQLRHRERATTRNFSRERTI